MSNVIEFKRERWCAGPVECFQCKHEWVGVWPEGLLHLYCPECDGPYGLPLDEQAPAEPEAEPVGSICLRDETGLFSYVPVYLHPPRPEPARKAMSDVEIADIYYSETDIPEGHLFAFAEGFRQAEKHHLIGKSDE